MTHLLHQTFLDAYEHDKIISLQDGAGARRLQRQLHLYRQQYRQYDNPKDLERMEEVVVQVREHTVILTTRDRMEPTAQEIEDTIEVNRKKKRKAQNAITRESEKGNQ